MTKTYSNSFHSTEYREDLPEFTLEDVAEHSTKDSVWVYYGQGVYDITNFAKMHPGGDKIMLAAGASLEPYFNLYGIHHKTIIYGFLESVRVGNVKRGTKLPSTADAYASDPVRSKDLVRRSERPFDAETPSEVLSDKFITPNDKFFVLNHLPVPVVDPRTYQVEFVLENDKCFELTLEDLRTKFKVVTIHSTIQCSGNRRNEFLDIRLVRGLNLHSGAIGNATWTGVRLKDLLEHMGVTSNEKYKHLQVEALDSDSDGPFGTNIPIEKALDPQGDVILAFSMNGEELPRDHGYPLRLIVPGYTGKRNVKWVKRITLSTQESPVYWHQSDYRFVSPLDTILFVDYAARRPLYEMPIQSAICSPSDQSSFDKNAEEITVKGYAYTGGDREVARVDVTTDGGESWTEAEITSKTEKWSWKQWKALVPIEDGTMKVCCRAADSAGNTQPEKTEAIWNFRGMLNNAWHCITVTPKE